MVVNVNEIGNQLEDVDNEHAANLIVANSAGSEISFS